MDLKIGKQQKQKEKALMKKLDEFVQCFVCMCVHVCGLEYKERKNLPIFCT